MKNVFSPKYERYIKVKKFWWLWVLLFFALIGGLIWLFATGPLSSQYGPLSADWGKETFGLSKYRGSCERCGSLLTRSLDYSDERQVVGTPEVCFTRDVYVTYGCSIHTASNVSEPEFVTTKQYDNHSFEKVSPDFVFTGTQPGPEDFIQFDNCTICGISRAEAGVD